MEIVVVTGPYSDPERVAEMMLKAAEAAVGLGQPVDMDPREFGEMAQMVRRLVGEKKAADEELLRYAKQHEAADERIVALERDLHEAYDNIERLGDVSERLTAALNEATTEHNALVEKLRVATAEARAAVPRLNAAYEERNLVVLLLARLCDTTMPTALGQAAFRAVDTSAAEGWQTVVYVEIAGKQMSWHLPQSLAHLALLLPNGMGDGSLTGWDGHTTEEKYERVRELIRTL